MTTDRAQWFAFRAYNQEARYGWGDAAEADEYCDLLNTGRAINLYQVYPLDDREAAELRLDDRDDTVNLDDALAAHKGLR